MAKLNVSQQNYMVERVKKIFDRLSSKEKRAAGEFKTVPTYSWEQHAALIKSGKAKLKDGALNDRYTYLRDAFDFPETAEMKAVKQHNEKIKTKLDAIDLKYLKELNQTVDRIMLSDSAEALKTLEALEKRASAEGLG